MSIDEYISSNLPFYHVTPSKNLNSILKDGLKRGKYGICVVRSDVKAVLNDITYQINLDNTEEFAVIRILPKEKGITPDIVSEDSVTDRTSILHNYIIKDRIPIEEKDILYKDYRPNPSDYDIPDDILTGLTGYHIEKRPFIDPTLEEFI